MDSREEALNALTPYGALRNIIDIYESHTEGTMNGIGDEQQRIVEYCMKKIIREPDQIITDNSKVNYNALARIKELEANQPTNINTHVDVFYKETFIKKLMHELPLDKLADGYCTTDVVLAVLKTISKFENGVIVKEK